MGMIGNYIAIEDWLLKQMICGEKNLLDIAPRQYEHLNIDKSWQAIHFLLCRVIENGEPPMGYVIPLLDDHAIDCELDYGASYLTAEQVKEAVRYLDSLNDDTLQEMYDFKTMLEHNIYPFIENRDKDEFYHYLHSNLMVIKNFFRKTAEKGYAVVFFII